MQIAVIVEPADAGYRARTRHPVEAETTGTTRYEATQKLEAALQGRVPDPIELVVLQSSSDKPWISTAGSIPDDETTDLWLDAVAEYRRQCDAADRATLPPVPNVQPAP
jgi:hypothetical protein